MCLIDDGADPAEFTSERWQRARKPHKCVECHRMISIGERYRYCVIKYDGSIDTYHTCAHCTQAEEWLRVHCHGWLFDHVQEDLEGHLTSRWSADEEREVVRPSVPARLLVGMRRKWRRLDGNGLMKAPDIAAQ
jgi:hypothetical protein